MKTNTTLILFTAITCSVFGCTLEDTEITKIAPDPNNAVYCPAKTTTEDSDAERILVYLQIASEEDSDEIDICTKDNCTSKTDCCGLSGDEAELYYLAFKYSVCPQNMKCMTDKNKEHYCEIKETECSGDFVKCNNECFNIMTDNMNCGECNSPCETRDIPHSKTVACMEGVCTAIYCIDGFHVNNQTNECEPDNTTSCGGTDCTKTPGWISGYCQDDTCVTEQCSIGYHVFNQMDETNEYHSCEVDNVERCGDPYIKCESSEGVESLECIEGDCMISKCTEGYHLSQNKDKCELNTPKACGSYNKDCYSDPTWGNGDDIYDDQDGYCDETLNCFANSCAEGYHPYNQYESTTFVPCQKDTPEHCGSLAVKCEDPNPLCFKGECVPACSDDLVLCGSECVDLNSNIYHCNSCNNACPQGNNLITTCDGSCHTTCDKNYGDCNDDSSDGCESSFIDRHLKSCATCQKDYADCTNKTNINCNVYLPNKHWTECNKCEAGYGDCDKKDLNGCETELATINWSECNKCISGYGNCDKKDENGCEQKLSDKNWSKCDTCKSGYADCDGKSSNGCEVKLADRNWTECNSCKSGFADCDGKAANGCEIKLADYGLKGCTTCDSGFTKCGTNLKNSKIVTCLKKSGDWDDYGITFNSTNCQKLCNQNSTQSVEVNGNYITPVACTPKKSCNLNYYEYYDEYDDYYYDEYYVNCQ